MPRRATKSVPGQIIPPAPSNQPIPGRKRDLAPLIEFGSLIINSSLAIIGIIALCVYHGQLTVMQGQLQQMQTSSQQSGHQTDQLIIAANTQAAAATSNAASAGKFSDSADKIDRGINHAVEDLARMAKASEDSIKVSTAAAQLDERPWVYGSRAVLNAEPTNGEDFSIQLYLSNSGGRVCPVLLRFPILQYPNSFSGLPLM